MPFDTPGATRQRRPSASRAGRYRAADGTFLPSVTQILSVTKGDGLANWANRLGLQGIAYEPHLDSLARAGTLAHARIEATLRGVETPDLSGYTQTEIDQSFRSHFHWGGWARGKAISVLALEKPLTSEIHRYGGTIDAALSIDGEPVICDWKTSTRPYLSHLYQLAAYWHLVRENRGLSLPVILVCCPRAETGWSETRLEPDERLEELFQTFLQAKRLYERLQQNEKSGPIEARTGE